MSESQDVSSDSVEFVEFYGEQFAVPQKFNRRQLWRFLRAASDGVDTEDVQGLIMLDKMLDAVVRPEDHARFDEVCERVGADDESLIGFTMRAIEVIAARPTGRPSDSSGGPATTSTSSQAGSSSQVISRLEEKGRPDLALIVAQVDASRASA